MTTRPPMPSGNHSDFSDSSDFSDLLLRLYGLSHQLPIDAFQDAALALVKHRVPFDTAMWGSGTLAPAGMDIHSLHLHRTSPEMLQAYDEHKAHDLPAMAVGRHRSATGAFHVPVAVADPGLRDFAQRFGHQNMFISADTDPDTRRTQWLSLYRADVDAHCTENERQRLQQLRPHLMQALAMNRMTHLGRLTAPADGPDCGLAVADLRGVVLHADAQFESLLRTEWAGWCRGALAPALLQRLQDGALQFKGRAVVVQRHVEHRLLFLRARARCRADALSARELQVARLVAQGHTHKQVAQHLVRAPATVRNHVQAIYAKLEVSGLAGLMAALRQLDAI